MDRYLFPFEDIGNGDLFQLPECKITPDFCLQSPELCFPTEIFKNNFEKKTQSDDFNWISFLNEEGKWREDISLKDHEQVVPTHGKYNINNAGILRNHNDVFNDDNLIAKTQTQSEISTYFNTQGNIEHLSSKKSNKPLFIVDNKALQVTNKEEKSIQIPPANMTTLFDFNFSNANKCFNKNARLNDYKEKLGSENISSQNINQVKCIHEASVKEKAFYGEVNESGFQTKAGKNKMFKLRKKILKLLDKTRIPRCIKVDYIFASNEKLPSFAETFCPNFNEAIKQEQMDLPEVLTNIDNSENDVYISDYETDCSEDETGQKERYFEEEMACDEMEDKIQNRSDVDGKCDIRKNTETDFSVNIKNKMVDTDDIETSSKLLTMDVELQEYFSNVILQDPSGHNQLSDLYSNTHSASGYENFRGHSAEEYQNMEYAGNDIEDNKFTVKSEQNEFYLRQCTDNIFTIPENSNEADSEQNDFSDNLMPVEIIDHLKLVSPLLQVEVPDSLLDYKF